MKMNKFTNLILFDLKNCIRSNRIILIATVLLFGLASFYYHGRLTDFVDGYNRFTENNLGVSMDKYEELNGEIHSSDYMLYMFRGMELIDEKEQGHGGKLDVPVMYLALMILFTVVTGRYIFSDISQLSLSRAGSRVRWLISKIISNVIMVCVIYLIGIAVSGIAGSNSWNYNEAADVILLKVDYCKTTGLEYVGMIFVLMLSAIAISLIQILISLYMNYFAGVITSLAIYVLSLFSQNIVFLGNGSMLQRSRLFMNGGYEIWQVIILDILVSIVSVTVLLHKIKKYDML